MGTVQMVLTQFLGPGSVKGPGGQQAALHLRPTQPKDTTQAPCSQAPQRRRARPSGWRHHPTARQPPRSTGQWRWQQPIARQQNPQQCAAATKRPRRMGTLQEAAQHMGKLNNYGDAQHPQQAQMHSCRGQHSRDNISAGLHQQPQSIETVQSREQHGGQRPTARQGGSEVKGVGSVADAWRPRDA